MHSNFFHIEDNFFVANNNIFGLAYKIDLPEKYSLSENDYDNLIDYWKKTFNSLENAIIVKHDFFIKNNFNTSSFLGDNFLQRATKDFFSDREYLNHTSYIFFMQADFDTYKNYSWHNPFKKVEKGQFQKLEEAHTNFSVQVQDRVDFLNSRKLGNNGNITLTPFTKKDFVSYENFYFSGLDEGFTTNIYTENATVYTGDKQVGIFTVNDEKGLPDLFYSCINDNKFSSDQYKFYKNYGDNFSFDLKFNHIYSQVFFIDDKDRVKRDLEETQVELYRARSWSVQNEVAADLTKDILQDIEKNDNIQIIRGSNAVIFFADTKQDFDSYRKKIASAFSDLDIIPHYTGAVDRIKADYYLNFPVYAPYQNGQQTYKLALDAACCLIQNTTHYKNDEEGLIFSSRVDNLPVVVDDYFEDKKYDNARNGIIIAPTGYGKSVLVNHKIRHQHERNDKTVVIDYGGSYSKYSAFYPNDVSNIEYKEGSPLGFNIFDISRYNGIYEPLSARSLNKISDYILIHTGNTQYSELEKEVFKKIVAYYYQNSEEKSFHDFYEKILDVQHSIFQIIDADAAFFDISKFLLLIKRFSKHGEFAFLYQETDYSIFHHTDKNIVIFELENAANEPILLNLLLFLIDIIIDDNILKDKSIRGHIIFDEVAKMYHFDGILEKVELYYQTIRKKNGAITQVLQTIHQMPEGRIAKSIIENTQVVYVLHAKDYKPIQQAFNLSDHALYAMQSLQSKTSGEPPIYSEMLLIRGKQFKIVRLELPPEVFWAYQTDGEKNAIVMNEFDKTKDMQKAIENILKSKK